jgi:hypothetical protein
MSTSSTNHCSPETVTTPARTGWKSVRPALRRILAAEILIAAAIFAADTPHGLLLRRRLSEFTLTTVHLQILLTTLAVLAVLAVAIEAARRARRASGTSRATPVGAHLA